MASWKRFPLYKPTPKSLLRKYSLIRHQIVTQNACRSPYFVASHKCHTLKRYNFSFLSSKYVSIQVLVVFFFQCGFACTTAALPDIVPILVFSLFTIRECCLSILFHFLRFNIPHFQEMSWLFCKLFGFCLVIYVHRFLFTFLQSHFVVV